jgi:hypothetical protein
MKCLAILGSVLLGAVAPAFAGGGSDLTFQIFPDFGVSSDNATICRVTVTNYSGDPLDGRRIGFEASAIENGVVVERERGRFQGILRNGEKAETLIGFNGVFRYFAVAEAPASGRSRSGGSSRGRKSASKSRKPKSASGKKAKKTN